MSIASVSCSLETGKSNHPVWNLGLLALVLIFLSSLAGFAQTSDPDLPPPVFHRSMERAAGEPRNGYCADHQASHSQRGRHGQSGNRSAMQTAMTLVHGDRSLILRTVEEVPDGVVTVTRIPSDPQAVEVLHQHVAEMTSLLESGGQVRRWDPLFAEIFEHAEEIDIEIETLEDGVRVTETSDNPQVVALIRAHARKVDQFIARGPEAVHEATPLPEGYRTAP